MFYFRRVCYKFIYLLAELNLFSCLLRELYLITDRRDLAKGLYSLTFLYTNKMKCNEYVCMRTHIAHVLKDL